MRLKDTVGITARPRHACRAALFPHPATRSPYTRTLVAACFLSMRANAPSSIVSLKLPMRSVILSCRLKSSFGSSFNIGSFTRLRTSMAYATTSWLSSNKHMRSRSRYLPMSAAIFLIISAGGHSTLPEISRTTCAFFQICTAASKRSKLLRLSSTHRLHVPTSVANNPAGTRCRGRAVARTGPHRTMTATRWRARNGHSC